MRLQVIKNGILKGILWITLSIILLFIIATSLLRLPSIQTRIAEKLTVQLSELTGFNFELGYINLNWFDVLVIEDLQIKDLNDSTLILAPEVEIDFSIVGFFNKDHRQLDRVDLSGLVVNLYKHNNEDPINITQFVDTLKYFLSGERKARFSIDEINLENSIINFQNFTTEKTYPGFDLNKFTITDLQGTLKNFLVRSDTITFLTDGLSGLETKTNLFIDHLNTDFIVHQKSMGLRKLEIMIGESILRDSIVFNYSRMANLSYFLDSVEMQIRLDKSVIHTKDLKYFASEFREVDDVYKLSGFYKGNVPNFTVRNLDLALRDGSVVQGFLSFAGLPEFEETFIGVRLSNTFLNRSDLEKYLGNTIVKNMSGIENIRFSGSFTGYPNDFVAYGDFDTNLGKLESDLNIKILENKTFYKGKLTTKDFDLGTYSGLALLGLIDMEGSIEGSGVTTADADFTLDGQIFKMDVNDYPLTNIVTNAHFATEFFEGDLTVNDPNFQLTASGSIDLRENRNKINVTAVLDTLIANELNLIQTPAAFSAVIDIDVIGLQIDSIRGRLGLKDFKASYDSNYLAIDELSLISNFDKNSRALNLETERASVEITGDYQYTTVYRDILTLLKEYKLNLENESSVIDEYYSNKIVDLENEYELDFSLDLRNINPLLNLFAPEVQISQNFKAEGNFIQGYTSIVSFNTEFDSLRIKDEWFVGNLVEVNASKIADSINVLAAAYVFSENQYYSSNTNTQNLSAEAIWDRNQIDFSVAVQEDSLESYIDLFGELVFLPDLTVIKFKPSDLQALNEKWTIAKDNAITISGKEIGFVNLGISKESETIMLEGLISEAPDKLLSLSFKNVELSNFNPIISKSLKGLSNGYFQIKNYYDELRLEIDIKIKDFTINDFLVGDVTNTTFWNNSDKKFDLNFEVLRSQEKVIEIKGDYAPKSENGLNLEAVFTRADLKIIEPFVDNIFSEIQGFAAGTFSITGNLLDPVFAGRGKIMNGAAKINYLNTNYTFDGDLLLQDNEIGIRNIEIQDRDGNIAVFNGGFFYENTNEFSIDFSGVYEDLMALNTSISDNELFYGTARGSGDIRIHGLLDNLKIEVNATSSSGTRIFIPLGGASQVDQEDFIRFVEFDAKEEIVAETLESTLPKITGVDFTLNLLITPDAYAEIIFDQKAGDIIRGRGNGNLKFHISPLGEFSLTGDYQFDEGGYNFTLYNIINKEFVILPDSKITWLGDPYGGTLDINAAYEQLASFGPLLDTAYRKQPEIKRRYPTKVILELNGPLLSPDIDFDIVFEDYPKTINTEDGTINLDTELSAIRAEWAINEQELQKQVFSLIILRQFSEESFNTGGTVGSSVSEFISNQLSYWISQVDENLEIDISLGSLSEEAYNTFQLRLSYTFLDGRLRVTRDGGFTDAESQAVAASIIGDWSLEYMISKSGNLRIKIFQKTDYNSIDNGLSYGDSALRAGFSFIYTQSFDTVKELMNKARKNQIQADKEDVNVTSQNRDNNPDLGKSGKEDKANEKNPNGSN